MSKQDFAKLHGAQCRLIVRKDHNRWATLKMFAKQTTWPVGYDLYGQASNFHVYLLCLSPDDSSSVSTPPVSPQIPATSTSWRSPAPRPASSALTTGGTSEDHATSSGIRWGIFVVLYFFLPTSSLLPLSDKNRYNQPKHTPFLCLFKHSSSGHFLRNGVFQDTL